MIQPDAFRKLKQRQAIMPQIKCPRVDFNLLKLICKRPTKDFHTYPGIGNLEKVNTPKGPYFYKDNGAKILVVAHLDSVQDPHWAGVLNMKDDTRIFCTTLDDRLGVYVALELLQKANLDYDILLTTNEETGDSTAQYFEPPEGKKYNWIVEFDREGSDAVTYNYSDFDWARSLRAAGFKLSQGSYSDIAELEHLNACGVNIGIGYHRHHHDDAYANLNEIKDQISVFLRFYNDNYEVSFKHLPKCNVITEKGLRYDPTSYSRFTEEEYEEAITLYESLENGASFESLGYPGRTRITKYDLSKMMSKRIDAPKTGPVTVPTVANKGSEDVVIFPTAQEDILKRIINPARNQGFLANVAEICVECGRYFRVAEPNTEAYCPECREVIASRHAKDYIVPGEARPALKLYLPPTTKRMEKVDVLEEPPLVESALAWLKQENISHTAIGMALKLLRENISEDLAKLIFDELIEQKLMKQFSIGKLGMKSNYSADKNGAVKVTQKAMSMLIDREKIDVKHGVYLPTPKWMSKMESGHRTFWTSEKEIVPLRQYLVMISQYIDEPWKPVLSKLLSLDYNKIIIEPKVVKEKPKLKVGLKFGLDISHKGYGFNSSPQKGGMSIEWKRAEIKEPDKIST